MTGVEILATKEVATAFTFNWSTFGVVFAIFVVISLVVGAFVSAIENDDFIVVICLFFGILLGSLFGTLGGSLDETPTEYETQYKVTISDEVSMNDFLEIYEIVDQEGKIYTVREQND